MAQRKPQSIRAKHIDLFPYTDEEKDSVFNAIKRSLPEDFHQLLEDSRADYLGKWISEEKALEYSQPSSGYATAEFQSAYEEIIAPLVNSLYRPHVNDFKSFSARNPGNAFKTLSFDVYVGRWTKKTLFDLASQRKIAKRLDVDGRLRNAIFDVFALYAGPDYANGYRSNETVELRLRK